MHDDNMCNLRFTDNNHVQASHCKKNFLRTLKMHKIKDIIKDNFTTNATVTQPVDCFLANGCKHCKSRRTALLMGKCLWR